MTQGKNWTKHKHGRSYGTLKLRNHHKKNKQEIKKLKKETLEKGKLMGVVTPSTAMMKVMAMQNIRFTKKQIETEPKYQLPTARSVASAY